MNIIVNIVKCYLYSKKIIFLTKTVFILNNKNSLFYEKTNVSREKIFFKFDFYDLRS